MFNIDQEILFMSIETIVTNLEDISYKVFCAISDNSKK